MPHNILRISRFSTLKVLWLTGRLSVANQKNVETSGASHLNKLYCVLALSALGGALLSPANAQEVKGAPKELIGQYGSNPDQCRSFNRKSDDLTTISKDSYEFCGGSACSVAIVSHRKTKDGYVLRLAGRYGSSHRLFKIVDDSTIEIDKQTNIRCTEKDIRAGVGLALPSPHSLTQSTNAAFSVHYAIVAADKCSLSVDTKRAAALIDAAKLAWSEFISRGKNANAGLDRNA